ncbi:MAG TPA: hypothetical protein VN843_07255 [Anaerolineales bacterium]|nr:hypothetical protein [Anaerolineales bacterium]
MPVSPTQIGYNGQSVRPVIQETLDKIDNKMLDPVYVSNNNLATPEEIEDGKLVYKFKYNGQLNEVEISTIQDGWISSGWTSVECNNAYASHSDYKDNPTWFLTLIFEP